MAAVGDNIVWFIYTGEGVIPNYATHVIVAARVVRAFAFQYHPNIFEVIFNEDVEKIERYAFWQCPSLKRVIMPGVTIIEDRAFARCEVLTDVECGKLEIIGMSAFNFCKSLKSINLTSARIVEGWAFNYCEAITEAKFGNKLERIKGRGFRACSSLERIAIPLKEGLITDDDAFIECANLVHVDLIEGELRKTIAALHLEEWGNDMKEEIDSINQILPNAPAGGRDEYGEDEGGKVRTIRMWIRSVLGKIDHYKAEHQRVLNEATTLLELAIWKANLDDTDGGRTMREGMRATRGSLKRARRELCVTSGASIVIKNVLPFLQLKSEDR